ncbi:MAG: glycoside hydrolase family 127 protein, partial [Porticoccaceae bacterium]|nr:glycoside hydrolase family 127 protein [Porticoccaceae bacterium]
RNGWLGGDGDGWERGPYWIDGLLPLAYILDDEPLKVKANKWVNWTLENQREDGYLGPIPFTEKPEYENGLQKDRREDWWPKMVMLKILQQHYSATGDERVIKVLSNYFKYQLKNLPEKPLGHWSFWGNRRGGDNLAVVYWLYNITGENYLLELGDLIFKQTHDWTAIYGEGTFRQISPLPHAHCVNVSQGLKQPAIQYQRNPDEKYLTSIKSGLTDIKNYFGYVNGMYGADENMHSNDPVQGSELCTAVEMMYSFEHILPISGDMYYADYLEKVAYNVLPTQVDDHYQNK